MYEISLPDTFSDGLFCAPTYRPGPNVHKPALRAKLEHSAELTVRDPTTNICFVQRSFGNQNCKNIVRFSVKMEYDVIMAEPNTEVCRIREKFHERKQFGNALTASSAYETLFVEQRVFRLGNLFEI